MINSHYICEVCLPECYTSCCGMQWPKFLTEILHIHIVVDGCDLYRSVDRHLDIIGV